MQNQLICINNNLFGAMTEYRLESKFQRETQIFLNESTVL